MLGGQGNDIIDGGDNDDLIRGGNGADDIDGGAGNNTASYEQSAAVTIDLLNDTYTGGDATGDDLDNIRNIIGSSNDDVISGDIANKGWKATTATTRWLVAGVRTFWMAATARTRRTSPLRRVLWSSRSAAAEPRSMPASLIP